MAEGEGYGETGEGGRQGELRNAGMLKAERRYLEERRSAPMLGHSADGRLIEHAREVFREDNIQVLMCFVCARKHVAHLGFDKFGKPQEKGNICYRHGTGDKH